MIRLKIKNFIVINLWDTLQEKGRYGLIIINSIAQTKMQKERQWPSRVLLSGYQVGL